MGSQMGTDGVTEPGNRVDITEVGPRDGLQSQPKLVDTATKLEFIQRLIDAGARRIEVVSFVNPKRVPQMADADELIRRLPPRDDVTYIGLVLNLRGFERALAAGLREINTAVVATETFSQRNQGMSPAQMLDAVASITRESARAGIACGATISAAFGCPYEGFVAPAAVVDIARRLIDCGVDEISLADTIGVAVPTQVIALVEQVDKIRGRVPLRMHFHNTRNTAIANVFAALNAGVRRFDTSCGGLGGCPFAPGATGNVGTEDVLYLLEGMGLSAAPSLAGIVDTTRWLETVIGGPLPAMVSRATPFPPVR
jgi:hydroxymethylglutaryl-CoA lyase